MQTIRQQTHIRSMLQKKAERDLEHNRGDYILAAIGIVGCVVILVLNLMGVA
jgi:hypothetical protein